MDYAEHTYRSSNPLKRFVHSNRFNVLLSAVPLDAKSRVFDYGCGDGYFLRAIASRVGNMVGYEPDDDMRRQGVGLPILADLPRVPEHGFTHIYCQEVLEHLTPDLRAAVFDNIERAASAESMIVFTIPIEHGPSGFAKNLFRKLLGGQPVTWSAAARSLFGMASERIVHYPSFGPYIFSHTGFDVRAMEREIFARFEAVSTHNDPLPSLPMTLNNSRIIVCRIRRRDNAVF